MKHLSTILVAAGIMAGTSSANAVTYYFQAITANGVNSPDIGEAQLSFDVTDEGNNQVLFTFNNSGPEESSITDVYFDDSGLLSNPVISDGNGVEYSLGASPGDLPGGENIDPHFTASQGFTADSDPPVQLNGVNPGESLGIMFTLLGGFVYDDVLNHLDSGLLRVGIHVQGFANGQSESFVSCVDCDVPPCTDCQSVPDASASLLLLSMAMVGLEGVRRKLRR